MKTEISREEIIAFVRMKEEYYRTCTITNENILQTLATELLSCKRMAEKLLGEEIPLKV